ncbi:MAG: hypothetical protein Q8N90_02585 [bacterium]|nr:hypothetical protein [bacterium]
MSFLATVASAVVVGMIVQYHWSIIGKTNLLRLVLGQSAVVPEKELMFPWAMIAALGLVLAEVLWILSKESVKRKGDVR